MLQRLTDLLVPPACWSCRDRVNAGSALCPACSAALPWRARSGLTPPGPGIDRCSVPLALTGPARDLVHALKFSAAPGVAELMAAHLVHGLDPGITDAATIVPVPAHPGRRRRRGYDHAEALAQALARRTGSQVAEVLVRGGNRHARQRGRGRAARIRGEALLIAATGPAPGRCLLIDDVRTTGATFAACASALRGAGARRVDGLAYAQAP